MGANLALNFEDHGTSVGLWDRDPEQARSLASAHPDRRLLPRDSLEELVAALDRPRRFLLMVPAGRPVDETLARLAPLLEAGDVAIDGGNSLFHDTRRRAAEFASRGLGFLGIGVSGGSEGARNGPSIMVGGPRDAYESIAPVLEAIAAHTATGPCVAWFGADGAGHFVKMVHNGIEYADMQSIAEAYDLLGRGAGLDADAIADQFEEWNRGPLESFLLEVSVTVLRARDPATGRPIVEGILDEAEQKGTGRWTVVSAFELGVPAPSISAAVDARVVSSRRTERLAASGAIQGPAVPAGTGRDLASAVRDALLVARIAAFAQGMDLLAAGSREYGWEIDRAEVARVWTGGCIIRARLLDPIRRAFLARPELPSLLLDPEIGARLEAAQAGLRRALGEAQARGIPAPVWSSALAWLDGFRTARLPQSLTQAQRDYFGAHGFRLLQRPEDPATHADWSDVAGDREAAP